MFESKLLSSELAESPYTCIICFELCSKPVSCRQCKHLLCRTHIIKLQNKCPYCRLEPFTWQEEKNIELLVDIEVRKRKEEKKKTGYFKCLMPGCEFEGKYINMMFHRKSQHFEEKIDEIIFEEDRAKKLQRDTIKRFFLNRLISQTTKYFEPAKEIYVKYKGIVDIKYFIKMLIHIDQCSNPECKEVFVIENSVVIGVEEEIAGNGPIKFVSKCKEALLLKVNF